MRRRPSTGEALVLGLGLAALAAGCHKRAPVAAAAGSQRVGAPTPRPTPTPVSDTIAFVRDGALWVEHSNGQGQRLLALPRRDEDFWFPAVDPDGSCVAAWLSRGDGTQDLVRVSPSGAVTRLTDTGIQAASPMKDLALHNAPAFSPDGKRIAYSFNGDIWIVDANGFNPQTFTDDGESWSPAFSPDGTRLAYVDGPEGHRDLWTRDLGDQDGARLTAFPDSSVGGPSFSADGSLVLVTRITGGSTDIVDVPSRADTPANDAAMLTHDHRSVSAAFAPFGEALVFSASRTPGGIWNLFTEEAQGGGATAITQDGGLSPAWSSAKLAVPAPASVPAPPARVSAKAAAAVRTPPASPAASRTVRRATPTATRTPRRPIAPAHQALARKPSAAPAPKASPTRVATGLPIGAHHGGTPTPGTTTARRGAASPATPSARSGGALPATVGLALPASFDGTGRPDARTLKDLKAMAARLKPYAAAGYTLTVVGPLDESDLQGLYPSQEARSQARARTLAAALAARAGFKASAVQAQPYSPPVGGGAPHSVMVYSQSR